VPKTYPTKTVPEQGGKGIAALVSGDKPYRGTLTSLLSSEAKVTILSRAVTVLSRKQLALRKKKGHLKKKKGGFVNDRLKGILRGGHGGKAPHEYSSILTGRD